MSRATLETEKAQKMEEGALHKWLGERGFDIAKPIERTEPTSDLTLFEQEQETLIGQFPDIYKRVKPEILQQLEGTP